MSAYFHGLVVGGVLLNQNYIEDGESKPLLIQPFFIYNFDEGILYKWFISAGGESQADWEKSEDELWLNFFGIGPGRNMNVTGQPMTVSMRFAPYLTEPGGGPAVSISSKPASPKANGNAR